MGTIAVAAVLALAAVALLPILRQHAGVFMGAWTLSRWTTLAAAPAGIAWYASLFGTPSAARSSGGRIALNVLVVSLFAVFELFALSLLPMASGIVWAAAAVLTAVTAFAAYRLLARRASDGPSLFGASALRGALGTATVYAVGLLMVFIRIYRVDFYALPVLFAAVAVVGLGAAIGLVARVPDALRKVAAALLIAAVAANLINLIRVS